MNLDPKKMQSMMKQLGIAQEEIDALRVIIEREDGKTIIENPSVVKIKMSGQVSYQISGEEHEEEAGISEADIKQVMEKTSCSKEKAEQALKEANGDLAEAILALS
jgi:nascent polypeptide-associated complex subunit alpha